MIRNTKIWKLVILVFALVFLGIFLKNIDFNEVMLQIYHVGWRFVYLILVTGFGYFLAAWAWLLCFNSLNLKHGLAKLFIYRMIGETLALLNPTSVIAGDASKVYFLKNEGVSGKEASAATLISRVLLIVSLIFVLILSAFVFFDATLFMDSLWVKYGSLIVLLFLSLGLLNLFISQGLYLYRFVQFISSKIYKLGDERLYKIHEVNQMMADYYKGHKLKFVTAFMLSALHWMSGAFEFFVILHLLNIPISLLDAIILEMGVMVIKAIGAFVPGQIGVEEQGNKMMLGVIGVSMSGIWVVVSILRRARQLIWLLIGVTMYLFVYKKQKKYKNQSRIYIE